jgi:endonuclease/exonuclease/phosphatase family metal-dependent hydrolase
MKPEAMDIGIITSNISADFLAPPRVPAWEDRKQLYTQVLRSAEPSLIGLQEVTPRQLTFLQAQLPEFTSLTVPIIDPDPDLITSWHNKYASYGLPEIPSPYEIVLFYHNEYFELLKNGHWWLSPTPDRPSIGFGNTAPRLVLWSNLRHRSSGHEFTIFNTHIDHRCTREMVELCRSKFGDFSNFASSQIFIGDLNFNPNDLNYQLLLDDGWLDSHAVASDTNTATFLYDLPGIPGGRIDHILYRSHLLTPITWHRLASPVPDRRISDHDPVYTRFRVG